MKIKNIIQSAFTSFQFARPHLSGSSWPSENQVAISNIKKEVNGENQNLEDYRHLPPWQWTPVSQLRDWDVIDSA